MNIFTKGKIQFHWQEHKGKKKTTLSTCF